MKVYIFSIVIFLYIIFCNINVSLTKLVVPEYHFSDEIHFTTEHGCKLSKKENNIKVKYTSFKKHDKLNKRLVRTPIANPFIPIYDFGTANEYVRQRVKNITEYAFSVFTEVFDFYQPLRVKVTVDSDPKNEFYGKTLPPVLYALRDPLENMTIAYPLPLVKQLNLDSAIDFDTNNEYDLHHVLDNDFILQKDITLDVVMVHEMLHGFGLTSQIRTVVNGNINPNIPAYHSEVKYYMPDLLEHRNVKDNIKTIETFVPISIWERHFVDYQDQTNYYFTEKFNSISETPLYLDFHEPMFASEKSQMSHLQDAVDNWQGLDEGVNFYEKVHQGRSVGFKTKDGRIVPVLTYEDGKSAPDLHHVCSRNINYVSPNKSTGQIDQNFAMYPKVIMTQDLNEILTKHNLGPQNKHGFLSDDLISILETMGYHRKGTPVDNRVFHVIKKHEVDEDKAIVDGKDSKTGSNGNKSSSGKNDNLKVEESSSSSKSFYYQPFTLIIFILFSFILSFV
ncbi:hypothetical protein BCR32DRAFT_270704 [Anaeromyces robustus]|uniref:Uncharacterized protein n=1 Tax=Anaeromyces robustus TaxID=1754192 RepID=A0A1Y1WV00_9FUNG|nr:hypothetical protein BCR32DRAFT_270704 [Anaeromyces robustus]|eukprot:ORX77381.1 hypothetical protein BCR32DRAFT_270704 [Anaeromyces robustus]